MSDRRLPDQFPVLETDRISLVELTHEHQDGILRNFGDAEMMRFIMPPITQETDAAGFIRDFRKEFTDGDGLTWALVESDTGDFLGTISYSVGDDGTGDLGFDIWRDRWGEGLMTEALARVVQWGFDVLDAPRITAHTLTDNERSVRLLHRLGFQVDETREGTAVIAGERFDEIFFSIRPSA